MLFDDYKRLKAIISARRRIKRGGLSAGMRDAVKNQVYTNFARFIKWFVSNYLRGGNDLKNQFLKTDKAIGLSDRFNPEPHPRRNENNPFSDTPNAPGDVASWLVDGRVRRLGNQYRSARPPVGAAIPAFLEIGGKAGAQAKSKVSAESRAAASADSVEDDSVGTSSIISADPTLPASLNGGKSDVKVSTDPSLAPQQ